MHRAIGLLCLTAGGLLAQLTPEQKVVDLQTIASLYAKQYAPYEWKVQNFGFDLFDLRPWAERARQTKSDLAYLELVTEYTAQLRDIHSYYIVNSDFAADLHLYVDIYDGKALIEQIDRTYLPASQFDFAVGDEIVQFDGRPVAEAIQEIAKLNSFANPRSTERWAADQLVYRQQAFLPMTAALGESATILVRRQNGGEKSYTIDWDKFGTPLEKLGPLPNFRMKARKGRRGDAPEEIPAYRKPWFSLQSHVNTRLVQNLRGFDTRDPVYRMPAGFVQRLGRARADYFYSGTYNMDGKRIGLIRIGTFIPNSNGNFAPPANQFAQEIGYMKANTDVLVVDVTRNAGGYACYAELLLSLLIDKPFQTIGAEIRPNLDLIRSFESSVIDAQDFGEEWEVSLYTALLSDLKTAYSENRGRTGPVPICGPSLDVEPARDRTGAALGYGKPILLLTDEFSTSAADTFAAVLQDAGAATLFGFRTSGAGGNTQDFGAGFFSEGRAAVTQMMTVRPQVHAAAGFPASRYVENVGVQPDIEYDYQTLENLLGAGAPFVAAFLQAAAELTPAGN